LSIVHVHVQFGVTQHTDIADKHGCLPVFAADSLASRCSFPNNFCFSSHWVLLSSFLLVAECFPAS